MILSESEVIANLPVGQLPETDEGAAPFSDLFKAGLRSQNTLVSAGQDAGTGLERIQARTRANDAGEPRFNPYQDIAGYEPWSAAFRDVETPEESAIVKRRIDQENSDRELLYVGGLEGFAAQLAAGAIDPVNLIPIGGVAAKGRSIVQGAARTAAAGAGITAVTEAGLQATQETRTAEESAMAIGAGTLLSGILGGAIPLVKGGWDSLGRRTAKDLHIPPLDKSDPLAPGGIVLNEDFGSVGSAAANTSDAKIKSALGVEKIVAPVSPIMRTAQSPSVMTRRTAQELVETPFAYKDNAKGVATPIAVETRIKMWQAPLAESFQDLDAAFGKYKEAGGELRFKAFREEVGKAMRRDDLHTIPEVQSVARSFRAKLFDPTKNEAIAVKLLPEGVKVETAPSYLSRVYNVEKITARRGEFVERVTTWLAKEVKDTDRQELQEMAQEITDHILAVSDGRIPYEAVPLKRGPLKERVLNIPDAQIEDFLESDIETVARFYTRTIVPDIELARSFGDPTMRDSIGKVADNYKDLIAKAKSEGERTGLAKRRDADIRDLEAMRDRLRGNYAAPADPNGFFVRAGRSLRNWNYLSMLGSMTLSSISDLARPVMVHGLMRTVADGLLPMITHFRQFKMAAKEAQLAGTALDMVLDSRAMELADIGDVYGRNSKFERGLQALTEQFGKVTLMTPWNAALKQFSSVITQDRIITAALKTSRSKKEIEHLAMSGIDEGLADRIAAQFKKHGEDGDVKLANTRKWTDRIAIEAFRGAVVKDVDRTIVTPSVGDRPLWMSSEVGKLIGQFRTFAFASTQKVLVSALQQRDMAALNGAILSTTLGMGVYALQSWGLGKETSSNPADWIREGVDRSGILGWLYEANNMVEKASGGAIGLHRLTGGEMSRRYYERGAVSALLGPSVGRVEDVVKATSSAAHGEMTESDTRAMRRLIPYQNVFYLRKLFDTVEDAL